MNYNFECDWLIKLSDKKLPDNKVSDNKLSHNNLTSELAGNRSSFKPITIEEIVIFMMMMMMMIIIIIICCNTLHLVILIRRQAVLIKTRIWSIPFCYQSYECAICWLFTLLLYCWQGWLMSCIYTLCIICRPAGCLDIFWQLKIRVY